VSSSDHAIGTKKRNDCRDNVLISNKFRLLRFIAEKHNIASFNNSYRGAQQNDNWLFEIFKEGVYFSGDVWRSQFFGIKHNLHLSSLHDWQK
jgi:hypothetical protein